MWRNVDRAEEHLEGQALDERGRAVAGDVAIIAGVTLSMLVFKAMKIVPGVPFAPGFKLVVLTPFYVVAALLTRSRFGATWMGLVFGTVSFFFGDGRYGVFEIAKHVAPGSLCDLLVPLVARRGAGKDKLPGPLVWSVVGAVASIGRVATIFLVTLAVQPPAYAYAVLIPNLLSQLTAGFLSGFLTYPVVRHVMETEDA